MSNQNILPIPKDLSEENAHRYLIMRTNLSLLKDESATGNLRNIILNDYYIELRKSQSLASSQKDKEKAVEEEKAKLEPIIEVVRAIADGSAFSKENGLIWQHWIDEAKKRVESLKSKKE